MQEAAARAESPKSGLLFHSSLEPSCSPVVTVSRDCGLLLTPSLPRHSFQGSWPFRGPLSWLGHASPLSGEPCGAPVA